MRLNAGEDPKIDLINEYVRIAKSDDSELSKEGLNALLGLFRPLMLSLCKKWSTYFNDHLHRVKTFESLMSDATYWFIIYTRKYTIDGDATYNYFMESHLDQRIRYIYQSELKHYSKLIFPDPDKHNEEDDMFDNVVYNYCSDAMYDNTVTEVIEREEGDIRCSIVDEVNKLLDSDMFNDRERAIFRAISIHNKKHDDIAREFGISRPRVSQIYEKVRNSIQMTIYRDKRTREMIREWQ